jgi:hypothetical protein
MVGQPEVIQIATWGSVPTSRITGQVTRIAAANGSNGSKNISRKRLVPPGDGRFFDGGH